MSNASNALPLVRDEKTLHQPGAHCLLHLAPLSFPSPRSALRIAIRGGASIILTSALALSSSYTALPAEGVQMANDPDFGKNAIVRDLPHKLDFLQLAFSAGMSHKQVLRELKDVGRFSGWRLATATEVMKLGKSAGLVTGMQAAAKLKAADEIRTQLCPSKCLQERDIERSKETVAAGYSNLRDTPTSEKLAICVLGSRAAAVPFVTVRCEPVAADSPSWPKAGHFLVQDSYLPCPAGKCLPSSSDAPPLPIVTACLDNADCHPGEVCQEEAGGNKKAICIQPCEENPRITVELSDPQPVIHDGKKFRLYSIWFGGWESLTDHMAAAVPSVPMCRGQTGTRGLISVRHPQSSKLLEEFCTPDVFSTTNGRARGKMMIPIGLERLSTVRVTLHDRMDGKLYCSRP